MKFMMEPKSSFSRKSFVGAILVLLATSSPVLAIESLINFNSTASIDPNSQSGMFNWTVDGQNQLAQQWFWYRVGNNPEQAINTISAPSITRPDAKTAYITYNNGAFSVEVDYVLTGQSPGSGQADIRESIRIHNLSPTNSLDFHFFQYSDFDLNGLTGGDSVALGTDGFGRFNEALQTKGPILTSPILTETDVTPGANHGEVGFFNATLVKLNNGVADNLNDNAGPIGPGDATWALQWDYSGANAIAPGGDALISKQKFLQVPEPSVFALVSLAAGALVMRRRCRS